MLVSPRPLVTALVVSVAGAAIVIACSAPALEPQVRPTPLSEAGRADAATEDGGAAMTAAEIYADGLCSYIEKCNPRIARRIGTGAECRQTYLPTTEAAMKARGRTTSTEALALCMSKLGATSCADTLGVLPECQFKGNFANGEPCGFGGQCESELCKYNASGGCGVCAPASGLGEDCKDGCGLNLVCIASKCVKVGRDGDPCTENLGCGYSLRCAEGTCRPGLGRGSPCVDLLDCDQTTALDCVGTPGSCQPADEVALGGDCRETEGAARKACVKSYCEPASATCKPFLQTGQAVPDGGSAGCGPGLAADKGVCAPSPAPSCL